jgi:antitoxin component of MazEF toxin-antitoxin module
VAREILKVRKVGGTLVVTLTQAVVEQISLGEGDRVLIEALPPKRILISKEEPVMPSIRRVELELGVLQARYDALDSESDYVITQNNLSMPCEPGMSDPDIVMLRLKQLTTERDKIAIDIAQKRLELFELQGS